MEDLLDREFVLSQSVAATAYDTERRSLDIEYYNGLAYRFFEVSPETGSALFQGDDFDRVFRTHVARRHDYKLVDKQLPVFLG
ncbi:MAG: KTSC domain-containing protein, partial [Pseudomonadota bacterium]